MKETLIRIIAGELSVAGGGKRKNSHRLLFLGINGAHLTCKWTAAVLENVATIASSRNQF